MRSFGKRLYLGLVWAKEPKSPPIMSQFAQEGIRSAFRMLQRSRVSMVKPRLAGCSPAFMGCQARTDQLNPFAELLVLAAFLDPLIQQRSSILMRRTVHKNARLLRTLHIVGGGTG